MTRTRARWVIGVNVRARFTCASELPGRSRLRALTRRLLDRQGARHPARGDAGGVLAGDAGPGWAGTLRVAMVAVSAATAVVASPLDSAGYAFPALALRTRCTFTTVERAVSGTWRSTCA